MLNIYYGRENIEKEKFLFDSICGPALILVPDQFTLETEQLAFDYLKTEGLMDLEVLSFSRLGSRLLSELGGGKQTFIDKYGRHMILASVARQQREKLQVFRGLEERNSFLELVNNFISELKQYNCNGNDLEQMALLTEEGSYTRKKLEDLTLLYKKYEEAIGGKYTDSEDYIDLYLGKIRQSEWIGKNQIWIYGFDSFAPKALQIIGCLMRKAREVNVILTWDRDCRDEELFDLTGLVMRNLEKEGEAAAIPVKKQKIPQDTYRRKNWSDAISHLERELYTLPSRKSEDFGEIHLTEAAGIYNEAESAAAYVLHLVRDLGLRYRDIRLVCNDQESRGPVIERIFEEYGIPVFSDRKRDILSSPIVQYITSLLDVVIEKYRIEDIFRVLKSGFGELDEEDVTDLENYALKYRIRRKMWLSPFQKGEGEYGQEGMTRLEAIRRRAVEPFIKLEPLLKTAETGEFIQKFYHYLYQEAQLPERILNFMTKQEAAGRIDLAEETAQIWSQVVGILDQMAEIIGAEPFEKETFSELFKTGLSQVEIGLLPPAKDGLLMGTMQRTRMRGVKALVVLGANEGVLPQEKPESGLFSGEEKELFREQGRELCKVDSIMQMEERMAIYRNLAKPEKFLWMSCSLADMEGKEIKPSSVFLKIKEIFPKLKAERDVLNQPEAWPLITKSVSGLRHLTEELRETASGKKLCNEWKAALAWYQREEPEKLVPLRQGLEFTNIQEKLGEKAAKALFFKDPEAAVSLSPSRLEKFSRCPFSHFIAYGLRPEERRVFQVAPREIGDIYHNCLMNLAQSLTREDLEITHPLSPWMTITREQCRELVGETLNRQISQYREGLFSWSREEVYRGQRIYDICDKACWAVIEQVRAGQIERSFFEVRFGRGAEIPPIKTEIHGEPVYIEGKIDRVDYLPGDRVKIIDYKTGNENFRVEEAKAGYRLQLMLYLQAACGENRKPAGVFYFHIADPSIDCTDKDTDPDTLAREIQKSFKLNGAMVNDPQVIASVAGDFEGFSPIVPLRAGKEKISGTGSDSLLEEEEFQELEEAVRTKAAELCRQLTEGEIDIKPMKTKTGSACTFCEYRGICRFDTIFAGCSYRIV